MITTAVSPASFTLLETPLQIRAEEFGLWSAYNRFQLIFQKTVGGKVLPRLNIPPLRKLSLTVKQ